jgi:hypothetical protein
MLALRDYPLGHLMRKKDGSLHMVISAEDSVVQLIALLDWKLAEQARR